MPEHTSSVQAYRHTRVATAGRGRIVVMLYDELLRQIDIARSNLEAETPQYDLVNNAIVKSHDIVTELMVALDMKVGGEVAQNLFNLYSFFLQATDGRQCEETVDAVEGDRPADYRAAGQLGADRRSGGGFRHTAIGDQHRRMKQPRTTAVVREKGGGEVSPLASAAAPPAGGYARLTRFRSRSNGARSAASATPLSGAAHRPPLAEAAGSCRRTRTGPATPRRHCRTAGQRTARSLHPRDRACARDRAQACGRPTAGPADRVSGIAARPTDRLHRRTTSAATSGGGRGQRRTDTLCRCRAGAAERAADDAALLSRLEAAARRPAVPAAARRRGRSLNSLHRTASQQQQQSCRLVRAELTAKRHELQQLTLPTRRAMPLPTAPTLVNLQT